MALKLEIFDGFRTYAFKDGEKNVEGAKQEAYLHVPGARYPQRLDISLPKGQPPLLAGNYVLGPTSYVVKDGALVVKPKAGDLKPMKAGA